MLSIIMTAFNESEGIVKRTIDSIKSRYNSDEIFITLVDDCSSELFDYRSVGADCFYRRGVNLGVGPSRMDGLLLSPSNNIMIIDAHMLAPNEDWLPNVESLIETNKKTLFCCVCNGIQDNKIYPSPRGNGSYLNCESGQAAWIRKHITTTRKIPIVMGACYFFHRDFFERVGGLSGLIGYGGDENILSLRYWANGGECVFIHDMAWGHDFSIVRDGRVPMSPTRTHRNLKNNENMVARYLNDNIESLSEFFELNSEFSS